jgi:phenylpropionate dioxygenase-like ring-hydroxylating dioxygenase large terminal subunit
MAGLFTNIDNDRLTRVGPGTPMGNVFRRFWLPFLLAEELPTPDCAPLRVRLLGEDLVAFRDTNGELGLLDRHCPHRRADLYFARNEQCGLRCVYHGWKFDVDGNVLDMPAEPPNTPLKQDIKIKSYPVREWGGVIWAYMGERAHMPATPPELEWGLVPATQRHISKRLQETNYAQGVEGGLDSSHVGILHSKLDPEKADLPFRQRQVSISTAAPYLATDTAPRFYIRPTDYGMLIGARRHADDASYYWRITQFLLPFYTMIARHSQDSAILGHAWTPIDDYNTWTFTMTWNPGRPLDSRDEDRTKVHVPVKQDGSYRPLLGRNENYGLDRDVQRYHSTTGIEGIGLQDAAVQESMGPIIDRSREILGSGDAAIVAFRKLLLTMADEVEQGHDLSVAMNPAWFRVRSAGVVLKKDQDFQTGAAPLLRVA